MNQINCLLTIVTFDYRFYLHSCFVVQLSHIHCVIYHFTELFENIEVVNHPIRVLTKFLGLILQQLADQFDRFNQLLRHAFVRSEFLFNLVDQSILFSK